MQAGPWGCPGVIYLVLASHLACASSISQSDGYLDDYTASIRETAVKRSQQMHNDSHCHNAEGWDLRGSDWGCCGDYPGCCFFASPICYAHDAMCRCCRLGRIICTPFCKPDPDCTDHQPTRRDHHRLHHGAFLQGVSSGDVMNTATSSSHDVTYRIGASQSRPSGTHFGYSTQHEFVVEEK